MGGRSLTRVRRRASAARGARAVKRLERRARRGWAQPHKGALAVGGRSLTRVRRRAAAARGARAVTRFEEPRARRGGAQPHKGSPPGGCSTRCSRREAARSLTRARRGSTHMPGPIVASEAAAGASTCLPTRILLGHSRRARCATAVRRGTRFERSHPPNPGGTTKGGVPAPGAMLSAARDARDVRGGLTAGCVPVLATRVGGGCRETRAASAPSQSLRHNMPKQTCSMKLQERQATTRKRALSVKLSECFHNDGARPHLASARADLAI